MLDESRQMYSFTSRVRYSETDERGTLSVPALINYLQDCSTFQSEALGIGPSHLAQARLAWLLSAWEVEIRALPRFGDEIRVSTWATGFKGLRASRNFTVHSAKNGPGCAELVRADSSWFVFDTEAQQPIRIPVQESAPYVADAAHDAPLDLPPIRRIVRIEGIGTPATPVSVTGAHLDTNHHVNNAQYVSIALGTLPEDEVAALKHLEVHYSRAAKLGDTIYPHVHKVEGGSTITLDDGAGKHYAIVTARA